MQIHIDDSKEVLFAKKIYNSLKENEVKQWIGLYPTSQEFYSLLKKMAEVKLDGTTEEMVEHMASQREKEAQSQYRKEFEELKENAKLKGLHWESSAYGNFIFDKTNTVIGDAYLNGALMINTGKSEFIIEGIEAVETTGGYRLQSVAGISRRN